MNSEKLSRRKGDGGATMCCGTMALCCACHHLKYTKKLQVKVISKTLWRHCIAYMQELEGVAGCYKFWHNADFIIALKNNSLLHRLYRITGRPIIHRRISQQSNSNNILCKFSHVTRQTPQIAEIVQVHVRRLTKREFLPVEYFSAQWETP